MDRKACPRVIVSLFWKQNGRHITSLMPNRRVIISKRPYISLIIVSLASKYANYLKEIMACESFVEHLVGSLYFLQQIFPNLNVVGNLAVPAGWGSCLPRLAIFNHDQNE